jgi:hypothetical protein
MDYLWAVGGGGGVEGSTIDYLTRVVLPLHQLYDQGVHEGVGVLLITQ